MRSRFVKEQLRIFYDACAFLRILFNRPGMVANAFKPVFTHERLRLARSVLKAGVGIFILLLGIGTYANFENEPYKLPKTPGLAGAYGLYNVREFTFNNQVIPYSNSNTNRWQNVVFEKWATVSIKTARPVKIDISNGDGFHQADIDRNFESEGVGGRHYYAYEADTLHHSLLLRNKNKNHFGESFSLQYHFQPDSSIVVQGVNEKNDSIYAVKKLHFA